MKDRTISIQFTVDQAEYLERILASAEDCGPPGEGWKSGAVEELLEIVQRANRAAQEGA